MKLSDFHFDLPEELIAQDALEDRKSSRMMLVDREAGTFTDRRFSDVTDILRKGDVLVVNNTKVFPARLNGTLETGGRFEVFLVNETAPMTWEALARPAKRLKEGKTLFFGERLRAKVLEKLEGGSVSVRFECDGDFDAALEEVGRTPLPPYIKRDTTSPDADRVRYQTVYAKERGAIAAPTAGLHFTPEIIETLKDKGVEVVEVTLHVGYGTFAPVRADNLSQHSVLGERGEITRQTADAVNKAKQEGRRVIAVGTTSTRLLESFADESGRIVPGGRVADLTITPGYRFKIVGGILTNFHLPESSLLILISTFGGHELIMSAYRHAVSEKYRFYSYGDCMLIV